MPNAVPHARCCPSAMLIRCCTRDCARNLCEGGVGGICVCCWGGGGGGVARPQCLYQTIREETSDRRVHHDGLRHSPSRCRLCKEPCFVTSSIRGAGKCWAGNLARRPKVRKALLLGNARDGSIIYKPPNEIPVPMSIVVQAAFPCSTPYARMPPDDVAWG